MKRLLLVLFAVAFLPGCIVRPLIPFGPPHGHHHQRQHHHAPGARAFAN